MAPAAVLVPAGCRVPHRCQSFGVVARQSSHVGQQCAWKAEYGILEANNACAAPHRTSSLRPRFLRPFTALGKCGSHGVEGWLTTWPCSLLPDAVALMHPSQCPIPCPVLLLYIGGLGRFTPLVCHLTSTSLCFAAATHPPCSSQDMGGTTPPSRRASR
jgi:hypothetical protein